MLRVMGDFNAKVVRICNAIRGWLYGLGETNEASEQLEDFWPIPCSNNIQGGCIPGPVLMATPGDPESDKTISQLLKDEKQA